MTRPHFEQDRDREDPDRFLDEDGYWTEDAIDLVVLFPDDEDFEEG